MLSFKLVLLCTFLAVTSAQITLQDEHPFRPVDDANATSRSKTSSNEHTDAELDNLLSNHAFPKAGEMATIQQGDGPADQLWKELLESQSLPNQVQIKSNKSHNRTLCETLTAANRISCSDYNTTLDPDCWYPASRCTQPKHADLTDDLASCSTPEARALALNSELNGTNSNLFAHLKKHNLRATLFYSGSQVVRVPHDARRALAEGHELCGYGWSQRYLTSLDNKNVFAELYYTAKAIKLATGVTPLCWRAPHGDIDDRIRAIAAGLGLRTIAENEEITHTMRTFSSDGPKRETTYKYLLPVTACSNQTMPYVENVTYPNLKQYKHGERNVTGLPDNGAVHKALLVDFIPVFLRGRTSSSSGSKSHGNSSGSKPSKPNSPPPPSKPNPPAKPAPPSNNENGNGGSRNGQAGAGFGAGVGAGAGAAAGMHHHNHLSDSSSESSTNATEASTTSSSPTSSGSSSSATATKQREPSSTSPPKTFSMDTKPAPHYGSGATTIYQKLPTYMIILMHNLLVGLLVYA